MKRLQHLLLLLFTIVGVVACSYNELPEELSKMANPIETPIVLNVETRAETYDGEALDQNYFVSEADLENYVRYRRSATKQPNLTVKEVKSYGFDSSQTLFYILNYEKGWEVVSADKRVQPTLAYGDEGAFTMDCDNEPMKFWMNILASGVLQTRQRTGDSAVATASTASKEGADKADDEEQNVAFWNAISPTQQPNTRDGGHLTPIPGPLEPIDTTLMPLRKYYLPHLQESFTDNIYYGPYIQTSWGQGYPWNVYCPIAGQYNGVVQYYKAGCVPVAVGQILYYLHDYYSLDIPTYERVQYTTIYDNLGNVIETTHEFIGESLDLWQEMATYYYSSLNEAYFTNGNTQYVASLLSQLGIQLGVNYELPGASSLTQNASILVFEPLDISCNYIDFNSQTAASQLTNRNMPLIIRAENSSHTIGHAWILDGYMSSRHCIRKYYILTRVVMDQTTLATLGKEDATGYEDSFYYLSGSMFHMNWGENGHSDGWYSDLSREWVYDGVGFNYNMKLLCGFSVMSNN